MCRLLGIKANRPVDLSFSLREAPDSLEVQSRRNRDGWGIAAWDQGGWRVEKRPLEAASDPRFVLASGCMEGCTFVAHVRLSSVGARTAANTHPFRSGPWVFAHNGTVLESERLLAATPRRWSRSVQGETDSERFFAFLLGYMEGHGAHPDQGPEPRHVLAAIQGAVAQAQRTCRVVGLNFLLSDGHTLYAHRMGYSLWWLDRRAPGRLQAGWSSQDPQVGTFLESKALDGEKAVIIASERLTGFHEDWRELGQGTMMAVTEELEVITG